MLRFSLSTKGPTQCDLQFLFGQGVVVVRANGNPVTVPIEQWDATRHRTVTTASGEWAPEFLGEVTTPTLVPTLAALFILSPSLCEAKSWAESETLAYELDERFGGRQFADETPTRNSVEVATLEATSTWSNGLRELVDAGWAAYLDADNGHFAYRTGISPIVSPTHLGTFQGDAHKMRQYFDTLRR